EDRERLLRARGRGRADGRGDREGQAPHPALRRLAAGRVRDARSLPRRALPARRERAREGDRGRVERRGAAGAGDERRARALDRRSAAGAGLIGRGPRPSSLPGGAAGSVVVPARPRPGGGAASTQEARWCPPAEEGVPATSVPSTSSRASRDTRAALRADRAVHPRRPRASPPAIPRAASPAAAPVVGSTQLAALPAIIAPHAAGIRWKMRR